MTDLVYFLIVFIVFVIHEKEVDENGLDNYDRRNNLIGTRSRLTGIIYKTDGSIDLWKNLLDTNPWWCDY